MHLIPLDFAASARSLSRFFYSRQKTVLCRFIHLSIAFKCTIKYELLLTRFNQVIISAQKSKISASKILFQLTFIEGAFRITEGNYEHLIQHKFYLEISFFNF